jgi:SNF2 family DNA or RNA helicase
MPKISKKISRKPKVLKVSSRPLITVDKVCSPRKRKEIPNRYLREELIQKAKDELGLSRKEIKELSYQDLCKELNIQYIELPPLEKKVKKEKKQEEVEAMEIEVAEKNCVTRSKLPLKDHQKRVIEILNKQRGLIAIHSTGSGKTLTAVTASQCFLDQNPTKKVIVITPTSLQGNFKKEMRDYGAKVDDERYIFYTFQGFSKATERRQVNCKDNMLIVDEAHNLRTMITCKGGKCVNNVISCAIKAKKVLLLTATPVVNTPYDMSNLVAMVDGSEQLSKHFYNKMLEDEDDFKKYFGCKISMFSPDEEEYKKYYPKYKNNEVFLEMSPNFYKLYTDLEQADGGSFISQLFEEGTNLQVFYNGVRRGSNNLEEESSPKVNWIMNKIRDSEDNDKFVIFSHFLEAGLRLLMNRLDKAKISYKHIDGSMSKKKREKAVEEYNNNEFKVLLISKAGGEGLDLKETRNIIIMEPSWNESTHKQVIGRAIRYKSHESLPKNKRFVDIYRLYMIKPEENKSLKTLLKEKALKIDKNSGFFGAIKKFFGGEDEAIKLSVDLYLRNFVMLKQEKINEFLESLRNLSIEKMKCDNYKHEVLIEPENSRKSVKKSRKKSVKKSVKKSIKKSRKKSVKKSRK